MEGGPSWLRHGNFFAGKNIDLKIVRLKSASVRSSFATKTDRLSADQRTALPSMEHSSN